MADLEGVKETKQYYPGIPAAHEGFHLKGAHQLDWGMRNRLSRIFRPSTGRTVMLAIDHGYFLGPTTGLERIDLTIVPLLTYADALMCTRGILRASIPSTFPNGVVMRSSGGPSTLKELSNELIAVDIDDAVRMNVAAMAGAGVHRRRVRDAVDQEHDDAGGHGTALRRADHGVTAVGKELTRDARYLGLATRISAELGAQVVKTYYCAEGFERVTAAVPVPIVMAGGKKLAELDALTMAYNAVSQGAAGVDMGRNIFQSDAPAAMIQAVGRVRARADAARPGLRLLPDAEARAGAGGREEVAAGHGTSLRRRSQAPGPSLSVGLMAANLMALGEDVGGWKAPVRRWRTST